MFTAAVAAIVVSMAVMTNSGLKPFSDSHPIALLQGRSRHESWTILNSPAQKFIASIESLEPWRSNHHANAMRGQMSLEREEIIDNDAEPPFQQEARLRGRSKSRASVKIPSWMNTRARKLLETLTHEHVQSLTSARSRLSLNHHGSDFKSIRKPETTSSLLLSFPRKPSHSTALGKPLNLESHTRMARSSKKLRPWSKSDALFSDHFKPLRALVLGR
jgi:hypothetical protein